RRRLGEARAARRARSSRRCGAPSPRSDATILARAAAARNTRRVTVNRQPKRRNLPSMKPIVVPGFRAAGVAAGIKKTSALHRALLGAGEAAARAAVFAPNGMRAAPVELSARRTRGGRLSAVVVNSGNANACTPAGKRDAEEMAARAAAVAGVSDRQVAV